MKGLSPRMLNSARPNSSDRFLCRTKASELHQKLRVHLAKHRKFLTCRCMTSFQVKNADCESWNPGQLLHGQQLEHAHFCLAPE